MNFQQITKRLQNCMITKGLVLQGTSIKSSPKLMNSKCILVQSYGTESSDMANYARDGKFSAVNPEEVQNCKVCHELLIDQLPLPLQSYRSLTRNQFFILPWHMEWEELHEGDKDSDYEDDVLLTCGCKLPYSSCGEFCCSDKKVHLHKMK